MGLFKVVEADPNKPYELTEDNGPWMIMACTFSGEEAEKQARALVQELRTSYKLPAYVHEMQFDFSKGTTGIGLNKYGEPLKMKYQRDNVIHEIAVLVGDYNAVDDPEAKKIVEKLKYAQPTCLKLEKGARTSRSLAAWRMIQQQVLEPGNRKKDKGPMGHAFVITNPLLPKEYFVPKGIDKLVLEMNKPVKHSLLDCPGRYSVQVATYTGRTVLDQKEIQSIQGGEEMPSRLAEAAEKAHNLTESLRAKGYEAYEFHDRYASIVTIGSFNSVGTPRADGKTEINPKIFRIMETFKAKPATLPGQAALVPKTLDGIPFDIQPKPVVAPKKSISNDYEKTVSR
ncbi:MAG: hypothetical protein ACYC0Y_13715 [Pirellulales bacterium]